MIKLAKAFKRNSNIRGIHVNQEEIKISQYADDTTLISNGSQASLSAALNTLDVFGEASGLKLNGKKTEAIWIGTNSGKTYSPSRKKFQMANKQSQISRRMVYDTP